MSELRAPRPSDAAAIAAALNASSVARGGRAEVSEVEVASWFEMPNLDPERDCRIVCQPTGAVVGYADVAGADRDGEPLWIDLRLRPDRLDAAGPLLDAMEKRAAQRCSPGTAVRSLADAGDDELANFLRGRGYAPIRSSFEMEIDLEPEPPAPAWPDGLSPRTFVPGEDDERVYEANQLAFADHWDFHPPTYEQWRGWNLREPFDPELWFLIEAGDEIAGLCLCRPWHGDERELGWVEILGVRPEWRRRGLGRSLLLNAFRVLRRRGRRAAGLGVDADNTTGAVRLYESAGMHVVRRRDIFEKLI